MGRGITGNYLNARTILFLRSLAVRKVRSQMSNILKIISLFLFAFLDFAVTAKVV